MGGISHFVRRPMLRRSTWPLYLAATALFLIFIRFQLWEPTDLGFLLPSKLQPTPPKPWNSAARDVLRPGDYVDYQRIRVVPDHGGEPPEHEPDGEGTLHDKRDERFWKGGLKTLTADKSDGPAIFDPYPAYNSEEWRRQWKGEYVACQGPRGGDLDKRSGQDMMSVYRGNQKDFPFPMFGSHEALGLDSNVCTDRCSRLGVYGYKEEAGPGGECRTAPPIDWNQVNWGRLQEQCFVRNANRYKNARDKLRPAFPMPDTNMVGEPSSRRSADPVHSQKVKPTGPSPPSSAPSGSQQYHARSAVLIRSWHSMKWTPNNLEYMRSIIMELSLHSGGEYEVFLIVDLKDESYSLDNPEDIQRLKDEWIPDEFHDMTIFFSEPRLGDWYPDIPEHKAIYQHLQPLQIFMQLHPNFDYVWQFEMDGRNTGHAYHFLDRIIKFGREQPRKYLWERNNYYYTPGAHGTWSDFMQMVDKALVGKEDQTVWGPESGEGIGIEPQGPKPPVASPKEDNYKWGVGEEAEVMTLLPMFDPRNSTWTFPNVMWGVPESLPRRASPVTMWRVSKRLLNILHEECTQGRAVVSEMSAPTYALLHGLKGVYVPHPLYLDGQWSAKEVAKIYNRGGKPEAINGGENSVWNFQHQWDHIMYRLSYMFTTQLAEDLWRRYMGYPPNPDQYSDGSNHRDGQGRFWYEGGKLEEARYGRLCFPPIFMHTVKNTEPEMGPDRAVPL